MNRLIHSRPRLRLAALGAALLLGAAGACKEPSGQLVQKVRTVKIAPDSIRMIIGSSFQVIVTPLDQNGKTIENKKPLFKSSDISVANITSTGLIVAVAEGNAEITATVDGVDGKAKVVVVKDPVVQILIEPAGGQVLSVGSTFDLRGKPINNQGADLGDRDINWSSSNPAVATVTKLTRQTVRITAVSPGTVNITAQAEGATNSIGIQVVPAVAAVAKIVASPPGPQVLRVGGTLQMGATPYDAQNNVIPNRPQTWVSSFPQVASVDPSTGKVTALAPGNTTISVTIDNLTLPIGFTVTLVPLKSISLTPTPSFDLFETANRQLVITLVDSTGAVASQIGRSILWQSSDQTVAQVNSAGVVSGITPGTATITATAQTQGVNDFVSSSTTANIKRINTASVVIQQTNISVNAGQEATLTAVPQDSLGRALPNRPITWASSDTTVFTIQPQGATAAKITGVKAGSATVTASNEGKSTTATVTVK